MGKSAWILVLGVALLVVGLDAAGVLPLGLFGEDETVREMEADRLADGSEGEAGLEGRAVDPDDPADDAATLPVEPTIPAEVRGTTRSGASIRGRVVLAATGQPQAGVLVDLRRPASLFSYLRAEAKGRFDTLRARTNREGRFAFLDVTPADQYVVRATQEGSAVVSSPVLDLRGGEQEVLEDLELGPAGTLMGKVVDGEGAPIADVRVVATWAVKNHLGVILAEPELLPEIEREAVTDAKGEYAIEGLEPGEKTVLVAAPSGARGMIRSVVVAAGPRTMAPDVALAGAGTIEGDVLYTDKSPVVGARVFVGPNQRAALRTVETDAQGRFRIEQIPEGMHVVGVLVPGMPVQILMGQRPGEGRVQVRFPMPSRIEGKVVNQATGDAVTKFQILAERTDETDFQQRIVSSVVIQTLGPQAFEAPDGRFTVTPLAAGKYKLTISAPGYPSLVKEGLQVIEGEALENIVVELPPGHVARGTVRRTSGEAVGAARIFVIRGKGPDEAHVGRGLAEFVSERDPDARTDAKGAFEIPQQAPGKIHLIAVHESGIPAILRDVQIAGKDVEGLELVLDPSGTVSGVILGEGGRPETNQQVYVLYRDGRVYVEYVSAKDARFEMPSLPVGNCIIRWMSVRDVKRYRKFVESEDEADRSAAYDELRLEGGEHYLGAGQHLRLTLRLPRRVKVSGQVRVAGEIPTRAAGVWFTIPEGAWGKWASCDKDGRYELGLEVGTYHAYVMDSKGSWIRADVEVPDQERYTLDQSRD